MGLQAISFLVLPDDCMDHIEVPVKYANPQL